MKLLKKYDDFIKNVINEAFKSSDMPKVLNNIIKYLNSKIGQLYLLPGEEEIKKQTGEDLVGTHFITDDGNGLRFNWQKNERGSELIHSIDFFDVSNLFEPILTLDLNGESIATILPVVVEIYKKKTDKIDISSFINEARTPKDNNKKTTKAVVKKASKEKKVTKSELEAQSELEAIEYADPETIFDDINAFVQMVVDGVQPSLSVTGGPGVGKTYGITKKMKDNNLKEIQPIDLPETSSIDELEELGFKADEETDGDWVHIKGASTAFGLYVNLYKYRNKIVVFDDCDKVFADKDAVNILKGALDSSDKRVISWISKATTGKNIIAPPRFEFKGSVIFISNLYMKQIDSAIRSRSFVVDVTMRAKDIILRIKTIMPKIMPQLLSMESKARALSFLEEASEKHSHIEISIRSLINNARIAQSGAKQWKRLMEIQAKNSI